MFVCLPESGADPTIESDSGFNAMDMAVAMGHRNGMCKLNTCKGIQHGGTHRLRNRCLSCEDNIHFSQPQTVSFL